MDNNISFECQFCSHFSRTVVGHIKHHSQHRHITGALYCGFKKCQAVFQTEASLRSHVIRKHNVRVSTLVQTNVQSVCDSNARYVCSVEFCQKQFFNEAVLLRHMKVHIQSGTLTPCVFKDCPAKFTAINGFSGHLSRYHRQNRRYEELNNLEQDACSDNELNLGNSTEMECEVSDIDEDASLISLAQFYLKLECKYFVPESTVQYVADELRFLFLERQGHVEKNVAKALQDEGLPPVKVDEITKLCAELISCNNFNTLRSTYKRKVYYKSNFNYVDPVTSPAKNDRCFYYVPISQTLQACFKNKFLNIDIDSMLRPSADYFKDFTDGEAFKNNNFFKENPKSVRILLYQDAFEIVCPIGAARRRKYKILAVYMAIGNLPPRERFTKDNIQLIALCREKYFSHEKVYGKIVSDLIELEQTGFSVAGYGNVKAGLAFVAGDNLGSHGLMGMCENFSKSHYFCRYCLVDRASFHKEGGECRKFPVRTVLSYKEAVNKLRANVTKETASSCHGIKFDSVFNQLSGYHVCLPGLPPCLGHDLFEGIVAKDLMLFIKYFISENWFSLQQLNTMIEAFPYSENDQKDRPLTIPDGDTIVGGAWQLWTFLRLFPLIVYGCIKDPNDSVWKCVLQLIEITEYVVAPEIHASHLPYLQNLINEYLINRKELFSNVQLKPKHHYLSHYPELILMFGPLIKVWTLRFESKHTFFKRAWKASHNSKNVLFTLSQKHELLQAFVRSGAGVKLSVVAGHQNDFIRAQYSPNLLSALTGKIDMSFVRECSKVNIHGTLYRKGSILVLEEKCFQNHLLLGIVSLVLGDHDQNVSFVLRNHI